MKQKMWKFIIDIYPEAIEELWLDTKYGYELQFYPNQNSKDNDNLHSCYWHNGKLVITDDF